MKLAVARRFPLFGPNKVQCIVRLVYEIARRDDCLFESVLENIPDNGGSFPKVKNFLERVRYPEAYARGITLDEPYSAVEVDPLARCDVSGSRHMVPKKIFIEQAAEGSLLAHRLRALFPGSEVQIIGRYKDIVNKGNGGPAEFNHRLEKLFVVKEQFDFFKRCPCTPGVLSCGYYNVNLGFGCPFECSYCFLQNYTNAPGIVFPSNIEDFFDIFSEKYKHARIRVGSGETTDSLALDHLTGFSPEIVDFFRAYPKAVFEFKTKSDNIEGLMSVKASSSIVVAWSVNPQSMIDREEFFTASLASRLAAARRVAEAGYRTAFHFDPVFCYPDWQKEYSVVIDEIFRVVAKDSIAWISLGSLRMTTRAKKMIENRFPNNTILSAELVTAPDGKVRYHDYMREEIYQYLLSAIRDHARNVPVYLCMEPVKMWRKLGLELMLE